MLHGTAGDSGWWQEAPAALNSKRPLFLVPWLPADKAQALGHRDSSVAEVGLETPHPSPCPQIVPTTANQSPSATATNSDPPGGSLCRGISDAMSGTGQPCPVPLGEMTTFPSSPTPSLVPNLSRTSCGTLTKQPPFSQPQFLYPYDRDNNSRAAFFQGRPRELRDGEGDESPLKPQNCS